MNITEINKSIINGIEFLHKEQLANGEFICYVTNNEHIKLYNLGGKGWYRKDSTVFPTILIGNSLLFLNEEPKSDAILSKITDFLLEQENNGVWGHYTKNHSIYKFAPFDADDTACASALLKSQNINVPDNADLLLSNRNNKKLFFTWFTLRFKLNLNLLYLRIALPELKHPVKSFLFWKNFPCARNDVDAVVNANVLYYLGKSAATLPVINYLIQVIIEGREEECDKWYKNPFTVYYFISRNYYCGIGELEQIRQLIADRIMAKLIYDGSFGNSVLDSALAVCTLLNFNLPVKKESIDFLLKEQSYNGSWKRRIFYYGGPKKTVGWGSEELTTAICLEALARYKQDLNKQN
ncbi:MAG: hypothetical protein JWR67_770 [Mucilaginibacter sp.]|nr:hypothetical protein [Mucilaginibacter sp.]MDB5109656.1 hypothetical protein [Mucilaginibacter sp.]